MNSANAIAVASGLPPPHPVPTASTPAHSGSVPVKKGVPGARGRSGGAGRVNAPGNSLGTGASGEGGRGTGATGGGRGRGRGRARASGGAAGQQHGDARAAASAGNWRAVAAFRRSHIDYSNLRTDGPTAGAPSGSHESSAEGVALDAVASAERVSHLGSIRESLREPLGPAKRLPRGCPTSPFVSHAEWPRGTRSFVSYATWYVVPSFRPAWGIL